MHNVYLIQPNYRTGTGKFVTYWLPYSVATIWAYVEQYQHIVDNFDIVECIYKREDIQSLVDRMDDPSVCLFSTYLWNEEYNLLLAKKIKEKYPSCKIIFGGPQIPTNHNQYTLWHPCVDSVVINEGEKSLLKLLEDILDDKLIPVYEVASRIDLTDVPSPYVDSNLLTDLIKRNPEVNWAATLETNRGCPFKCTFCDWGSLTQSKIKVFNLEKVISEIEWIAKNKIDYAVIADANFGVFYERDKIIVEHIAKLKNETGYPNNLNATWYKNSADKTIELVSILGKVGLNRGMTLSVQSLNDSTLGAIERKNMELSKLEFMYKECDKQDVKYYTEFILGMPLETLDTWKKGLCTAIQAGCHYFIDAYPLEILKNSELVNQIEKYDLEVFNFKTIQPDQDSNIPESHNYVVSTNTMNKKDYIDSWLWTWLLVNFHNYGWTQILARFALRHYGMSHLDFYNKLFNECILNDQYLYSLYSTQKKVLEDFYHSNNDNIMLNDYVLVDRNTKEFHNYRNYIQDKIANWATETFTNDELLDQVIDFNNTYITNKNRKERTITEYSYNIYDYIVNNQNLNQITTVYKFSNRVDWEDDNDFYEKVYYRARFGFNLQEISN
jgi:putative methyltransferase